jgi:spermidine synthase
VGIALEHDDRGGVTVLRDGHPQSYVHLDDPGLLVFEYVQHLALALDVLPAGRLAVTHVGGAGLTLPRYVEHTRPGSPQVVLEPDEELTAVVRAELPLPRRHRIRVRPVGGAAGLPALRDASADVLVLDAFDKGRVPGDLLGRTAFAHMARVLRPGGLVLANLSDEPGLRHVARVAATARTVMPHVALLGLLEVLKGRRFGNVVLLASDGPLPQAHLARQVARADFPTGMRSEARTATWSAGSAPFGELGRPSPAPPAPGQWRRR